jgi:hypothetical protein
VARQWHACAPSVAAGCAHCLAPPSSPHPPTPSPSHALAPSTPGDERPPSQPPSQPTSHRDAPGAKPAKRGIFGFFSPSSAPPEPVVEGRESKASWADSSTRSEADEAQSPGAGKDSSRKSRSNSFSLRRSKGDGGLPPTRPARARTHAAPHAAAPHAAPHRMRARVAAGWQVSPLLRRAGSRSSPRRAAAAAVGGRAAQPSDSLDSLDSLE